MQDPLGRQLHSSGQDKGVFYLDVPSVAVRGQYTCSLTLRDRQVRQVYNTENECLLVCRFVWHSRKLILIEKNLLHVHLSILKIGGSVYMYVYVSVCALSVCWIVVRGWRLINSSNNIMTGWLWSLESLHPLSKPQPHHHHLWYERLWHSLFCIHLYSFSYS
jgi:hypothetical protein